MKKVKQLSIFTINIAALVLAFSACSGSDDSDNKDGDTDTQCTPVMPAGSGENGDSCMVMEDCKSGFCATYSHAPADPDATCEAAPEIGDVHLMATVTDFLSEEIIPNQEIKVGGGIDVAQNPEGFPVKQTIKSDADGKVDALLTGDTTAVPLAIIVVAESDIYYPTSTGLVTPEAGCGMYPPATRNADIKLVKKDDLTSLSQALESSYPEEKDNLPLGDQGGVLGVIKGVDTGDGIEGTVIKSTNDTTASKIYYLNEARDGFTTDKTSSNGIFVILHSGLAEEFSAFINNKVISRRPATAGETKGVLFATTLQAEDM
ncbi:MAG: hypothetical protein JXR91_12910 [Deltaproteobacteria bacterium]|nr:hypothetical protein [Deltaproteobacteria bacterium]